MSEAFNTEKVDRNGITVRIEYFYDDTYRPEPWKEYDVNIYAKGRACYARDNKNPSEIYLKTNGDTIWAYDIREAHKKALTEKWCTGCDWANGLTKRQIAARAVAENVEFWRDWLNDGWFYAGVVCTVLDEYGEETDTTESCWGFETFNDYHETAGREMAEGLINRVLKERANVEYWASRDVVTTEA